MIRDDAALSRFRALPRPLRFLRARSHLLAGIAAGVAIACLGDDEWRQASRLLIAWDTGVVVYLAQIVWIFFHTDTAQIRRNAVVHDEGRFVILTVTAIAAFATFAAIFSELAGNHRASGDLMLAIVTVLLSWLVIHVAFALHYAHDYYRGKTPGGLAFPGNESPDYWDFLYFSLVIGMTAQVADVAIESRVIRRTVTAHGVAAFLFNTTLLALMVNIAASAL